MGAKGTPATVASMQDHATVLVSAGRRGLDLELAPEDLAHLAGAVFVALSAA